MQTKKVGNKILLRLDKDDEIVASIKAVCSENGVKFGFVTGIGGLKHVIFSFYDRTSLEYVDTELNEDLELTSLLGNVARKDGEVVTHLHVTLGKEDLSIVGGHLVSAVISVTGEIWIEVLEDGFERKFNEEFGLNLLAD